jgi:uncharacterized membrane protein YkvA (DUF1232 family)
MNLPKGFRRALSRAGNYLPNASKTLKLVDEATRKSDQHVDRFKTLWNDFHAMSRLVRCWINGTYRRVPVKTILWVLAALIYFVDPFDLIPDAIPLIGYVDDMTIVGFVINGIRGDLSRFLEWEDSRSHEIVITPTA